MAIIKDFKRLVNDLKNYLHSVSPNVDTSPGTYTRDVIIDAPANELANLYNGLSRASNSQSLEVASVEDIEKLGRNFQVFRKGITPASGIITFYTFEEPSPAISIPRGTYIASKASADGTARQYVTTQDALLSSVHFRTSSGRFEVNVPVKAVIGGTSSNVAAGALSSMMDPIAKISGVYNAVPITNGADFEPSDTYRSRIKSVLIGNNAGTASGYYQTITRITEVLDAKVAAVNTGPEALRRNDTGTVDVYIRGLISTQAPVETFTVPASTPFSYYLIKQPLDITSVDAIVVIGSISGVLTVDTDYTVVQDTSTYGGTVRGSDKITFIAGVDGEEITVLYSYNSLVESAQSYMEADERKILGSDILISAAFTRLIDVTCTIRILSGFTSATVVANVTTNLQSTLNAYQIGQEVQQSDIVAVITSTSGVDDVTIPLDRFAENSDTGTLTINDSSNLIIPTNSYAAAGDISISVRV